MTPTFRFISALLVAAGLAHGIARAEVRVAIVPAAEGDATEAAITGATGALSSKGGVAVVERSLIAAALAERRWTALGLNDPRASAAAGEAMGADAFAVVTPDESGRPIGVVVFAARDAARLVDVAISAEPDAAGRELAAAVRLAIEKLTRRGEGKSRTVGLISVRNADLPRAMDGLADAIGDLLQRRLLASPGVAVLERQRLAPFNAERALPTDRPAPELPASMVMMALEVSRGEGEGTIVATVQLSGGHLSEPIWLRATDQADAAAAVADALSREVWKAMGSAAGEMPATAAAIEARRLGREADLRGAHGDHRAAIAAGEAAHALLPGDDALRVNLAVQLVRRAHDDLIESVRLVQGKPGPPPNVVVEAMAAATRAIDLYRDVSNRVREDEGWLRRARAEIDPNLRDAIQYIAVNRHHAPRPEFAEPLASLREAYTALRQDRLSRALALAEVSPPGPNPPLYRAKDVVTTDVLTWMRLFPGPAEGLEAWLAEVDRLLTEADRRGPNACGDSLGYLLLRLGLMSIEESLPTHRKWAEGEFRLALQLCERLAKSDHPVTRLYGLYGMIWANHRLGLYPDEDERLIRFRQFQTEILKTVDDRPSDPGERTQRWIRDATDTWSLGEKLGIPLETRNDDADRLANALMDRDASPEMVLPVLHVGTPEQVTRYADTLRRARAWAIAHDVKHLAASLNHKLDHFDIKRGAMPPPEAPWVRAEPLLTVSEVEGAAYLCHPAIEAGELRVLAVGTDGIALVRRPLDGSPRVASRAPWKAPRPIIAQTNQPQYPGRAIVPAVVRTEREWFVATGEGVAVLPIGGGEARWLRDGLPAETVQAIAMLGGKLYLALGDRERESYVVRCDPDGGACEVLVSSRRASGTTDLDDGPPFAVPHMVADEPRGRVVFWAYPRAALNTNDTRASGVWSIDARTGRVEQKHSYAHLSGGQGLIWAGPAIRGKVLAHGGAATFEYDLATDRHLWISGGIRYYSKGTDERPSNLLDRSVGSPPFMRYGDELWSTRGRTDLRTSESAELPRVGKRPYHGYEHGATLLRVGDDVLYAHGPEVWLLKME